MFQYNILYMLFYVFVNSSLCVHICVGAVARDNMQLSLICLCVKLTIICHVMNWFCKLSKKYFKGTNVFHYNPFPQLMWYEFRMN